MWVRLFQFEEPFGLLYVSINTFPGPINRLEINDI